MAFNTTLNAADGFSISPSTGGATRITAVKIYVGGTGGQYKDVNVVTARGTLLLHKGVPVGSYISGLQIAGVCTTNTTASAVLVGYGPD